MSRIFLIRFIVVLSITIVPACSKLLDKNSITELNGDQLFASDQSAIAVVLGITNKMMEVASFFNGQGSRYLGLYADELVKLQSATHSDSAFYDNNVKTNESILLEWWNACFNSIYLTNSALSKLAQSTGLSAGVRQQLEGEVLFLRALVYFYLVNVFGEIPLVLDTDPAITRYLLKSPKAIIYHQVIDDLLKAFELVSTLYPAMAERPSNRCRVNKGAAASLLSKAYLHVGDYTNAVLYSTWVLNDAQYRLETDPDNVFLAQSSETIFALYPTNGMYNTSEGRWFLTGTSSGKPNFAITPYLLQCFEAGDTRGQKWTKIIQSPQGVVASPYKYKVYSSENKVLEYTILMRLAEVYMMRAEAYWAQGKLADAIHDINVIRRRANLSLLGDGLNLNAVRAAIEQENQVEFFTECGHRFIDLKRWGRAGDLLALTKPGKWKDYMINLPIPRDEVRKSAITQNKGYTD